MQAMDDGKQCLLDVIGDPNALDSFLGPIEEQQNALASRGNLGSQRFPELTVNTSAANNDNDDIFSELFSPTNLLSPFPTNGIQDSIQSAAALAGITSSDCLDDTPAVEPTPPPNHPTNANTNQSNDAAPQGNLTNHAMQVIGGAQGSMFGFKTNQIPQTATSFTTTTQSISAPIQTLQPISNVSPQVNTQAIQHPQQQQATITLPHGNAGGSIQLSLTPQQLAALQQGGRIQSVPQTSSNAIQVLPPQPQIVQAIQPNGTPVQLALLPSGMQLGTQFVIRQPLKPGTKIGNQPIVASPSRTPANIQPKLTNASQVNKTPISIRPYQVALAPQMTTVASPATQGNIVLQQPGAAQTLQLTNLAQAQQQTAQGGQSVVIQNPVSGGTGVPVVTMGVSHGSIIVMTQTRPSTTTSQPHQSTLTVNSSGTKVSLAPSPSTTLTQSPQPIKPAKPAPKKKKSKKKSKEKDKTKPVVTSAPSKTLTVTTTTTSAIQQQTTPAVTYTQTYVTTNGQTIMVTPPVKQGRPVPIVQQINLPTPAQSLNALPVQPQQGVQQQVNTQQFQSVGGQVTMSTGQQIIANIPQQNMTQMSSSEQQQQYLIQQAIKMQQEKHKQIPATRSPQQILPAIATSAANIQQPGQNHSQPADPRHTPSPRPPVVQQIQLGQGQLVQSNQSQLQPAGQNQLQPTGQNQLQPTEQNQLQPTGQNQLQSTGQNHLQSTGQNQLQPGQKPLQPTQNSLQPGQNQLQSGQNQLQPGQNQLTPGQNQLQPVLQSNPSHSQPGVQMVLTHGQNQLKLVPGSQSGPVQNQVQLVSSSQQPSLQKQQVGQLLQQQQQQQVASSAQQQQQVQVTLGQKPQLQLVSGGAGGVHVIRTATGQSTVQPKSVQELQQWLQQNPQAFRQFQELKRQHMLKQQQLQQQQKQQQQQQQSGLQLAQQPKQENHQQVNQSQPQAQQSQLPQVNLQQQQVQQQQQPQLQIEQQKQPDPQVQQSTTQTSQPTFQQQPQQPQQQQIILQTTQQQQLQQPQQHIQLMQLQQSQTQQSLQQQQQQIQPGDSSQQNQQQQQQSLQKTQPVKPQGAFEKQFQQFLEKNKPPEQVVLGQPTSANQTNFTLAQPQPGNSTIQVNPGQAAGADLTQQSTTQGLGQRAIHQLPKQVGNFVTNVNVSATAPVPIQQQPMSIQAQQPPMSIQAQQPVQAGMLQLGNSNLPKQPVKIEVLPGTSQTSGQNPQPQQQRQGAPANTRAQISVQTQHQLQVIQANIRKLSAFASPTQQQKDLLQQLIQLQNKVIQQARQHLIQSNAQVSPQAPGSTPQPVGTTPITQGNQQPVTLHIQSSTAQATATVGITSNMASPQKNAVPGLKIVTGTNLSPQQKILMNQLTEQLKKLTPEQQKALIQQQQLLKITQGKQGGKLIIQPASSIAAANPQNIVSAGKIIISTNQGNSSKKSDQDKKMKKISQGPSKAQIARSNRFARRLLQDQVQVQKTDFKAPFSNVMNAVTRLLPFHICRDETKTEKELEKAEEEFEEKCSGILQRKQEMINKYQLLLFQESMRVDPSAEMVMIDRMFVHEEKLSLEADRKHAAEHPEIYDQIIASRPKPSTDSPTDLETTATTTIKSEEQTEADTSIVQSPTTSTKKMDKSDCYSPGSSPTQAGSEANTSFSPVDSKVNHSAEKRGSSESSLDKSFDELSETDELMEGSFDNATVTKVSANDLKVTFRKQKKTKKKSGGSSSSVDSNAITYSVQNHVKLEPNHVDGSSTSHLVESRTESNLEPVKEPINSNGSTNGKEVNKIESKPHQRSDSCVPFRKRKFKQITDDAPVGKAADERDSLDNRTSSSSTPTPVALSEKMSRVEEDVKSVFRFDSVSEEDRTSDSVFQTDKPAVGGKSDFEFENVSEPDEEGEGDELQFQMASAINSILDLQRPLSTSDPRTPRRFSTLDSMPLRLPVSVPEPVPIPPVRVPVPAPALSPLPVRQQVDDAGDNARWSFGNHMANSAPPYKEDTSVPGLSVDSAYSSTAMGYGEESNTMDGISYGSAFNMDDSNITRTVTSQEVFGTSRSYGADTEETSIVDELQNELTLLQSYGSQPEDDTGSGMANLLGDNSMQGGDRSADPDLEEAVNSILF